MAYSIKEKCNGCTACAKICPTGAVYGEKKKSHWIDADICIDCGVCGKLCPAGAIQDQYGLASQRVKRKLWAKPVFDKKRCMACVICLDACPTDCIALNLPEKKDPNAYPEVVDAASCLSCGFCAQDCPVGAVEMHAPA